MHACAISSGVTTTNMYGNLNTVTITDTRGGTQQWTLTATAPNFTDGTHTISHSLLAITPSCALVTGDAGVSSGAAGQNFGAASVALCTGPSVADPTSQTTGGQWTFNAPVQLAVPAYQAAGNYSTTITINLAASETIDEPARARELQLGRPAGAAPRRQWHLIRRRVSVATALLRVCAPKFWVGITCVV